MQLRDRGQGWRSVEEGGEELGNDPWERFVDEGLGAEAGDTNLGLLCSQQQKCMQALAFLFSYIFGQTREPLYLGD